jgi:hypothetical protein
MTTKPKRWYNFSRRWAESWAVVVGSRDPGPLQHLLERDEQSVSCASTGRRESNPPSRISERPDSSLISTIHADCEISGTHAFRLMEAIGAWSGHIRGTSKERRLYGSRPSRRVHRGRVGTPAHAEAPLTEPDLWASHPAPRDVGSRRPRGRTCSTGTLVVVAVKSEHRCFHPQRVAPASMRPPR